jgi:hypothetical protein
MRVFCWAGGAPRGAGGTGRATTRARDVPGRPLARVGSLTHRLAGCRADATTDPGRQLAQRRTVMQAALAQLGVHALEVGHGAPERCSLAWTLRQALRRRSPLRGPMHRPGSPLARAELSEPGRLVAPATPAACTTFRQRQADITTAEESDV